MAPLRSLSEPECVAIGELLALGDVLLAFKDQVVTPATMAEVVLTRAVRIARGESGWHVASQSMVEAFIHAWEQVVPVRETRQ